MEKIKIAQVITRLDWGGSPDIFRILYGYLKKDGVYDVRLISGITVYPKGRTWGFLEQLGPDLKLIPELIRDINPAKDLAALFKLYQYFRKERFDIVHTHTAKAGMLGRIAARLAGVPVIIHTPHGHNFYGYFGPVFSRVIIWLEKMATAFTDKIIVLTILEERDYIKYKVAREDKIAYIHTGLEFDKYERVNIDKKAMRKSLDIEDDEPVIGMLARLEPVKGPEYFIEAAKEVAKKNARSKFIVVGDGSLRDSMEEKVARSGLEKRFIFTGWRDDIPELLSIFDIMVLPSLNEAVGIALIEAQAMGVPVVATNVGGVPEVVRDGDTGILVPSKDPVKLANAINHLLENDQLRKKMGELGKIWVKDRFRVEDMVFLIFKLYKELLEKRDNVKK